MPLALLFWTISPFTLFLCDILCRCFASPSTSLGHSREGEDSFDRDCDPPLPCFDLSDSVVLQTGVASAWPFTDLSCPSSGSPWRSMSLGLTAGLGGKDMQLSCAQSESMSDFCCSWASVFSVTAVVPIWPLSWKGGNLSPRFYQKYVEGSTLFERCVHRYEILDNFFQIMMKHQDPGTWVTQGNPCYVSHDIKSILFINKDI